MSHLLYSSQKPNHSHLYNTLKVLLLVILLFCFASASRAETGRAISVTQAVVVKPASKPSIKLAHKRIAHQRTHRKKLSKKKHSITSERARLAKNLDLPEISVPNYFYKDKLQKESAPAIVSTLMAQAKPSSPFVSNLEQHLVSFVHTTVANLHYSDYKLGGRKFDLDKGVYVVDCSSFVDNILRHVSPHAYSSLVNATGSETPASQHYYDFFKELDEGGHYWDKVANVNSLRPGDILVFRYKNSRGRQTGGHVMVVMDKPTQSENIFFVRVADSAPSRHSQDTRQSNEAGIGIGTLLLKVNQQGQPSAFAWGIGSYWNRNVKFAMGRPLDVL